MGEAPRQDPGSGARQTLVKYMVSEQQASRRGDAMNTQPLTLSQANEVVARLDVATDSDLLGAMRVFQKYAYRCTDTSRADDFYDQYRACFGEARARGNSALSISESLNLP